MKECTKWKNVVHALLDQRGVEHDGELFSASGRESLAELTPADSGILQLETYLETIGELAEKIESLSDEIEARAGEFPEVQLLETTPEVGAVTELQVSAEIGERERVEWAAELVSYAGLDPSVRESAGSRTTGRSVEQGNKYLRTAIIQGG